LRKSGSKEWKPSIAERGYRSIQSNNFSSKTKLKLKDLASQIAISEVLNPTLGVTEQVLAGHKLVATDNIPRILSIDDRSELGAFYVYFGIEGEPYYFVVVVREEEGKLIASASYIEAAVRVYLRITSTSLDPIAITERLKLTPTQSRKIGDIKHPRNPQLTFQEHRWYFEPQQDIPGNIENKLRFLLDRLKPLQSIFATLQNECDLSINICYEGYKDWMGGWHIDRNTILEIAALGAEVDLDLYALGKKDLRS
jgi:hypothetical protein